MNTPKTLTTSDSQLLLEALLAKNASHKTFIKGIRNYLIGCLMLDAGLRVGEVIQLKMSDLYYAGKPVTSIIVRPAITKTKTERSIPVSISLACALEEYRKHHLSLCDNDCTHNAFGSKNLSTPITTRQVERIINAAAWKALGRPVHPHVLRHTFASRLMRVTDMRTVQELLGHKNIASTQIYTHPNEEDKKKAIFSVVGERDRFGNLL
ncbi:Tyrosine recombinase XerC [subsurface metagenome]